jgi:hypothetical protein
MALDNLRGHDLCHDLYRDGYEFRARHALLVLREQAVPELREPSQL